jgi:CRP/FNR family cyclic AMP-dependent transcriptional regulator
MIETDYIKEGDKLLKDVRKIPALADFSDDYLRLFLRMSKIRKYKQGEIICQEGQVDNWLYFLLQGEVKVAKRGKELAVFDRRGEMFGEMGLVDGSPRSASILANATTVCLATDTDLLIKMQGSERDTFGYILFHAVAVNLASRLQKANEMLLKAPEKFEWKSLKKKFF